MVGYSFGGTVAQQLARQAPDRVRRMALVGTSCGWGSIPPTARAMALMSTPLRYYSRRVLEQTNHLLDSGSSDRESDTWRAQAAARLEHPPTLTGYTQQLLVGMTWSSLHWVSTLRPPVLVLAGGQDRIVPPANGALLSHLMFESRLHVLPTEGHLMLFDPDSRAHDLLTDFFSSPNAGGLRGVGSPGKSSTRTRWHEALRTADGDPADQGDERRLPALGRASGGTGDLPTSSISSAGTRAGASRSSGREARGYSRRARGSPSLTA